MFKMINLDEKKLDVPLTPSHIAKKLEMGLTHASKIVRELYSTAFCGI